MDRYEYEYWFIVSVICLVMAWMLIVLGFLGMPMGWSFGFIFLAIGLFAYDRQRKFVKKVERKF